MKTIGMIGGMSWESTAEYYRLINEKIHLRLGGNHSAKIVLYSFDFAEIEDLQHKGRWGELDRLMVWSGRLLEKAGADFIVLCTNTMHKSVPAMEQELRIPVLHIADVTGEKIIGSGIKKAGLLGTRFTMEDDFYRNRLMDRFNIEVIIPEKDEREIIHKVIYDELVTGKIWEPSKAAFLEVIENLGKKGAGGVILGCTEIPLLVKQHDTRLPLFDTTMIHAEAAVEMALK